MPFILPALPAIAGMAGGLLGRATGGASNYQKQGYNLLNTGAQAGMAGSEQARNLGMGYLNSFSSTLGAPKSYFQSLLSGNPAVTTAAMAPDIARITGGTQQALQSTNALSPRGSGRSSILFNLPQQAQTQVSGLFNQLRPQAASELARIAGMEGTLGANLFGTGAGYLGAGTGAARGAGEQANIFQQQQRQAGAGAGSMFANIMQSMFPTGAAYGPLAAPGEYGYNPFMGGG